MKGVKKGLSGIRLLRILHCRVSEQREVIVGYDIKRKVTIEVHVPSLQWHVFPTLLSCQDPTRLPRVKTVLTMQVNMNQFSELIVRALW